MVRYIGCQTDITNDMEVRPHIDPPGCTMYACSLGCVCLESISRSHSLSVLLLMLFLQMLGEVTSDADASIEAQTRDLARSVEARMAEGGPWDTLTGI